MQGHMIVFQAAMTRRGELGLGKSLIVSSIDSIRAGLVAITKPAK